MVGDTAEDGGNREKAKLTRDTARDDNNREEAKSAGDTVAEKGNKKRGELESLLWKLLVIYLPSMRKFKNIRPNQTHTRKRICAELSYLITKNNTN